MKRSSWVIGCALAAMLMLGGCGNQPTKKTTTDKAPSAKQAAKKAAHHKKAKKTTKAAPVKTTAATKQKVVKMDLAAIKRGDYASLVGEWQPVAAKVNYMDGNGTVWDTAQSTVTLNVTASRIMMDDVALANNQITANGFEAATGNVREQAGAMTVEAESGPHDWVFGFYPANTSLQDDTWPASVDKTKEHLTIWHGDQPYMTVFERRTPGATPAQSKLGMNLSAIATGDYSSMNGTWKNGQGRTITVKNKVMTFSDFGIGQNRPAAGTVSGMTWNIPSMNEANGQPKKVLAFGHDWMPGYDQKITVYQTAGQMFSLQGHLPDAAYVIGFMPAGQDAELENGDASRDRIVAMATQSLLQQLPAEDMYYKISK